MVEIIQLDVGQGDCTIIIVRDNHHNILRTVVVDCGGGTNGIDDASSGVKLINELQQKGVNHIDIAIISHFETDHFGGFVHILKEAKKNTNNGLAYRTFIQNTVFFDRGQPGDLLNTGSFQVIVTNSYGSYVNAIYDLNTTRGCNINRISERIRGYHNSQGGIYNVSGTRFSQGQSAPYGRMYVQMTGPTTLLNQDLMNPNTLVGLSPSQPIPNMPNIPNLSLRCVTVNQFRLNNNINGVVNLNHVGSIDDNDNSLTLLLKFHNYSHWLNGELRTDDEEDCAAPILRLIGNNRLLSTTKVGHHGSNHSTSVQFLNTVRPDAALISCSPNYYHGHPGAQALDRLEQANISKVFMTGYGGPTDYLDYLNYYSPFSRGDRFVIAGSDLYNIPGSIYIIITDNDAQYHEASYEISFTAQNLTYNWVSPTNEPAPYFFANLNARHLFSRDGNIIDWGRGFALTINQVTAHIEVVRVATGQYIGAYQPQGGLQTFYF